MNPVPMMNQYYQGYNPNVPPPYNPSMVHPSAPPADIAGYGGIGFNPTYIPPPNNLFPRPAPSRVANVRMELLTEEHVRSALADHVNTQCCWGTDPLKDMQILAIEPACGFHYTLETFTETRQPRWTTVPYKGGHIDGPQHGHPPLPWNVTVAQPGQMFQNCTKNVEVPHTAYVSDCELCDGYSTPTTCFKCDGNGTVTTKCNTCAREGRDESWGKCHFCKEEECGECNGRGESHCSNCSGTGKVKTYLDLTVTWTNHKEDATFGGHAQSAVLPTNLVSQGVGQTVFKDQQPMVAPFDNPQYTAVSQKSHEFIRKHSTTNPNELIRQQRHEVRAVPITWVKCSSKGDQREFYVYGSDRKVYFPNYYDKCSCCSLM